MKRCVDSGRSKRHRKHQPTTTFGYDSIITTSWAEAQRRRVSVARVCSRGCFILIRAAGQAFIGLAAELQRGRRPSALGIEQTTVVEVRAGSRDRGAVLISNPRMQTYSDASDVRLIIDDARRGILAHRIVSTLSCRSFRSLESGEPAICMQNKMYDTAARGSKPMGSSVNGCRSTNLHGKSSTSLHGRSWRSFPRVSLWRNDFYSELPVVGLVGQFTPKPLDLARIGERALHLPEWRKDPLFSTRQGVVMLYVGNLSAIPDLFASAPTNTDDRPLIEFLAPRLTRVNSTNNSDWFTGESLSVFYDDVQSRLAKMSDPLLPESKEITAARRAGTALYHYAVAVARHDDVAAAGYQTQVNELVPEVIAAGPTNPRSRKIPENSKALQRSANNRKSSASDSMRCSDA